MVTCCLAGVPDFVLYFSIVIIPSLCAGGLLSSGAPKNVHLIKPLPIQILHSLGDNQPPTFRVQLFPETL